MPHAASDHALSPAARAAALFIAVCAIYGLGLQWFVTTGLLARKGQGAIAGLWMIVAYFTILTNTFVAAVCLAAATGASGFLARHATRTGAALYILVVMAIYELTLRQLWSPGGAQWWADVLLHYVVPVLYALWWLVFERKGGLGLRHLAAWLVYPLAYLAYVLARALRDGLYPYPFIDVSKHGYAGVGQNSLAMLLVFVAAGAFFLAADRLLPGARSGRARLSGQQDMRQ